MPGNRKGRKGAREEQVGMGKGGGIYRERPQTEQGEEGKPKTRDSENNTQDGYVIENIG